MKHYFWMRRFSLSLLMSLMISLLMWTASVFAQSTTTSFTVRVRTIPSDQSIPAITVIFRDQAGQTTRVTTDSTGDALVTLGTGRYWVAVEGQWNGLPVAFESLYTDGYPIQSFAGLATFTLTIDEQGTVVHVLERDYAGPSQENNPTSALAPPATGTAMAYQPDTSQQADIPPDDVREALTVPTAVSDPPRNNPQDSYPNESVVIQPTRVFFPSDIGLPQPTMGKTSASEIVAEETDIWKIVLSIIVIGCVLYKWLLYRLRRKQ